MEADSNKDSKASPNDDESSGWTTLYTLVVAALAGQVLFYAWLTRAFE